MQVTVYYFLVPSDMQNGMERVASTLAGDTLTPLTTYLLRLNVDLKTDLPN
jgi:hypothetical protein